MISPCAANIAFGTRRGLGSRLAAKRTSHRYLSTPCEPSRPAAVDRRAGSSPNRARAARFSAATLERHMKRTLIALGAGAGCLLMAGSALAGPCTAQIEQMRQLQSTDAGMGPTGGASPNGVNSMGQTAANSASPSDSSQTPTHPPTGSMNGASQNKATSAQDVQNQNAGQGPMAGQANGTAGATGGNPEAAAALARAQELDRAGDAGCMTEVNKAQDALKTQP